MFKFIGSLEKGLKDENTPREDFNKFLEVDSNKAKDLLVIDFFILLKKIKKQTKEKMDPNLFLTIEKFARNHDFSLSLFEKFKNILSSIVESEFLANKVWL